MTSAAMPVVAVLAGGLATRLHPITQTIPKALVEVAGEPFVSHQLRLLACEGVTQVVLLVGHLGEQIEAFVGDGARYGLSVTYSFDGGVPLGTGGAIVKALPKLGGEFMVLYGDSYLDVSYTDIVDAFRRVSAPALLTVFRNENRLAPSNVVFDGHSVVKYSKVDQAPDMDYIDFGISMLTPAIFDGRAPDRGFDLAEVFQELTLQGQLAGYEIHQRFFEIGSHAGLQSTERYIRDKAAARKGYAQNSPRVDLP